MENNNKSVREVLKSVVKEMFNTLGYVLSTSIFPLSKILVFTLPYLMLLVGVTVYKDLGLGMKVFFLIVPVLISLLSYFFKSVANKLGKGETPPVPYKRFTSDDGDGEVSVENSRVQEMLLFVYDYEEWLERKGLL